MNNKPPEDLHNLPFPFPQIPVSRFLALIGSMVLCLPASAQERWFQIEVSVFSNESLADRAEENWQPERQELRFPENMQRLKSLLDILLVDSLLPESGDSLARSELEPDPEQLLLEQIAAVGPPPASSGEGFRFIDFARDSFLQLPTGESDFQQTNRALDRSAEHRLLFHGLWRQPVVNLSEAAPVFVSGGQNFGESPELQGSITIGFNDNRDRVVIDADLWLTEYSTLPLDNADWELPSPPAGFLPFTQPANDDVNSVTWHPIQVYHMQQSREMRSTEFHYLDHPALGIVVTVFPYEVPPPINNTPTF